MQVRQGFYLSAACAVLLLIANSVQANKQKSDCYGSIGGVGGHIYQFDGGVLSLNAVKCKVLLAQSRLKFCNLQLFAQFGCKSKNQKMRGLSRLQSFTIIVDGRRFTLTRHKRLTINGKAVNLPHSEKKVRVFRSGDDLVFVHEKCRAWVTFDGKYTATFRLGKMWRRNVVGLAGNCDGNYRNDPRRLSKSLYKDKILSQCTLLPRRKIPSCSRQEYRSAKIRCSRIISKSKCKSNSVLNPCIRDFCSTATFPKLQQKVLCANFYLHSRRCARHSNPIAWRVAANCPAKCNRNEHFSSRMSACPKTCDSHFFGSPRRCFKLVPSEGCKCNKGFVLDGSRCVRPENCVCLAKLCIDRAGNSKCRYWRSLGRCRKFPKFMSSSCRLTCGLCTPSCTNQVSNKLCKLYSKKGLCSKSFYRSMCKATCNPAGCGCPPRRIYKSRCSRKYRNIAIVSKRWWPDANGNCQRSISVRYRPCALCRRINKTVRGRCNFCTKRRTDVKVIQSREKFGKRRCIRKIRKIIRSCICKRRAVSYLRCLRHSVKQRVTKFWRIKSNCSKCVRAVSVKVIRRLRNCRGYFTVGKCKRGLRSVIVSKYRRVAINCKCKNQRVWRRKIMCKCRNAIKKRICSGNRWLIYWKVWILRGGRCIQRTRKHYANIKCNRRHHSRNFCHKCKAYRKVRYFGLAKCICKPFVSAVRIGVCCCKRGYKRIVRVSKYLKKEITVIYKLVKYRCKKIVKNRLIRIRCPRGGKLIRCNRRNGVKTFIKFFFVRKVHSCIRKVIARKSSTICRRQIKRSEGRCIRRGYAKYRITKITFWRRSGCRCKRQWKKIRERCGCIKQKSIVRTKCNSKCSSSNCSSRCIRYVTYYRIASRRNRCRRIVFLRQRFRCCCKRRKRTKTSCRKNRYLIKKICQTVLRRGKCQRICKSSSSKVKCRIGRFVRWRRHSNKNLRYKIILICYIAKCKCKVKFIKKICKSRCNRPVIRKFCDSVTRKWVWQRLTWKLIGCKKCVKSVTQKSRAVKCRKGIRVKRRCLKNGVYLFNFTKFYQTKCKCRRRRWVKRKRCRCRKQKIGRRFCRRNTWIQKVKYWILRNHACIQRIREIQRRVSCGRSRKTRISCNKVTGIQIKFIETFKPKRCNCVRFWRPVSKNRCNCILLTKSKQGKVRRYCSRNQKVTVRYYYKLISGRCILRTRVRRRSIRCSRNFTKRHRCNLKTRKQLYVKHIFRKRNCKCQLIRKRFYRRCGCSSKILRKRKCLSLKGIIVRMSFRQVWSHKRNRCETQTRSDSHRVACSRKTRYTNSKCIRNKYFIVSKIYYVRKACRCFRKIKKSKRNCHCKSITRRGKCPKRGYYLRERIQIRKWNMKKRRCLTVKVVTRRIRCRCRPSFPRRRCVNGYKVKERVTFTLRRGRCHKRIIYKKYKVNCKRRIRFAYTTCKSCWRLKKTLMPRLNKRKCTCYYAVVRQQKCRCCCPKSKRRRRCAGNSSWIIEKTDYTPFTGRKCSRKCRVSTSRRRVRISCSRRRRLIWSKCNRNNCVQQQLLLEYRLSRCRCRKFRRFTGKRRSCCCLRKPRTKRICLNSCLFIQTNYQKLLRWRCVQKKKLKLVKIWKCRGRVGSVVGRCNRQSCKQKVQQKYSIVDKPRCRCRTVLRNLRYRRCCCNKKNSTHRRCLGRCWRKTRKSFSFDRKRRVCVRKIKSKLICIKCKGPVRRIIRSRCNKRSCRRRVTTITASVRNCLCKRKRQHRSEICCCRKPTESGPICIRGRKLLWRKISWKLRSGRCVPKRTTRSKLIKCRHGVVRMRVRKCNRLNCKQTVMRLYLRLRKCKCRKFWKKSVRVCCCRPAIRRRTRCERNFKLVRYTVTRSLNRRRQCISNKRQRILFVVKNCTSRTHVGKCNAKSKFRIVTISIRKPLKCKCRTVRVVRKRVLCKCPNVRIIRRKCNRSSCHRKLTKIWFSSSRSGHGVKCKRHNKNYSLRCCCHRRLKRKVVCDQKSGAKVLISSWLKFISRRRVCIRQSSKKVIKRLRCPLTRCIMQRCNRKSGFKLRICTYFKPLRNKCRCTSSRRKFSIVCSCKKGFTKKICVGNTKLVRRRIWWRISLKKNRCIRNEKRTSTLLRCRRKNRIIKKCMQSGCRGFRIMYFYRMKNCKCKQYVKKLPIKCCCSRGSRVSRCHGNRVITTIVKYSLRNDRCIRNQKVKVRYIRCRRKRIVNRTRCSNCRFNKITRIYSVRKCKCRQIRRIVKKLRCCCRKNFSRKFCRKGVRIVLKFKFYLRRYKCFKQIRKFTYPIQCKKTVVKIGKCHSHQSKRKISVRKFVKVGCKCLVRNSFRFEVCRCSPPRVVRQRCNRNRRRRKVFKYSWKLIRIRGKNPFCRKNVRVIRTEPCICSKMRKHSRCVSGNRIVTVKTYWKLRNKFGRNFCLKKSRKTQRLIRCRRRSVTWSRCYRFRKVRTIISYKSVRCHCRKFVKKRSFACNCNRKNTRKKVCDSRSGRIIKIFKKYFARRGGSRCSSVTKRKIIRVVCNRRIHTSIIRKCSIRKNDGIYSLLLQRWKVRVGCKCRRRSRKLLKLCRCNRGSINHKCRGGNRKVKVTVKIIRKGNRCIRRRIENKVRIGCRNWRPKIKFGGCNRKTCKRSASVRQCFVRKCRRHIFAQSKLQICCTPSSRRRTYCDKKKGAFVTVITTFRLVSSGPLLRDRNGRVLVKQRRVVKRVRRNIKPVRCRRNQHRETCSRNGVWKKITFVWRRVGCHCPRKRIVRVGRCKCSPKRKIWGRCGRKYKLRTIISFVLKARKCLRFVTRRKFLCRCKRRNHFTVCDRNGNWKKCTRSFILKFRKQKCQKLIRCRKVRQTCSGPSVRRSKCRKYSRIVTTKKWFLNKRKCKCYSRNFRKTVGCNCHLWKNSFTKCIRNSHVKFYISHYLRRNLCRRRVRKVTTPIRCSKRKWRHVIKGSCVTHKKSSRRGMQKLRIKWFVKINCKCIPKYKIRWIPCRCNLIPKYRSRKFVSCHRGNLRVFKFVKFILRKWNCKKVVSFKRIPIRCRGTRITNSKCRRNKNGDKFKIIKTYRKVSNGRCSCRWQIARTVYRICKCRRNKQRPLCLRNRIKRFEKWLYVPVSGRRICKRIVRRRDSTVRCKRKFSRNSKCSKCRFTRIYYAFRPVNCKCKRFVSRSRRLRCCCPKTIKRRGCDAKRNMKFLIVKKYKLTMGKCILQMKRFTSKVRCSRKLPLYRISKCKGGRRQILKTVYRTVNCKCLKKVTRHRQRCSCSSKVYIKRGKCGKWFAIDAQIGWKLRSTKIRIPGTSKFKFKCVKVILSKRKRRCRCPKGRQYTRCRGNITFTYRISYRIRGLNCQRIVKVYKKVAPCSVRRRLLWRKKIHRKCSKRNNYVQILRSAFIQSRKCKCVKFYKNAKYICNCFRRFGGKKINKKCLRNRIRIILSWWYVNLGMKCVRRNRTVKRTVKCTGKKIIAGKCNRKSRKRNFQILHRVAKNCHCVWRRIRSVSAPCRCKTSSRIRRCIGRNWVTEIRKWNLIGSGLRARCKVYVRRIVKKVKCIVGTFITKSKCNSSGWLKITRTVCKLRKCHCDIRAFYKRCRCRCRKPKTRNYCRGRTLFTERRRWFLKKCGCQGDRKVTRKLILCQKRRRFVGNCRRGKNGDRFRKITEKWQITRKCKCKNQQRIYSRLCGCDRRQRRVVRCLSNRFSVIYISIRKLIRGRCRRSVISRRRIRISCGSMKTRKTCNRKSGVYTIVVIKPFVAKCKCLNTVLKFHRRCKCNSRTKLVSKGKCIKSSCRRRLLYKKKILRKMRCVWKRFHRFVTCCCKGGSVRKLCRNGYFLIVKHRNILKGTTCVPSVSKNRVYIKCKRNRTRKTKKLRNGILKIKICVSKLRGCRCAHRCKLIYRRYKCYKTQLIKRCECSRSRCRRKIRVKSWKLVNGRCIANRRIITKPLRCHRNSKSSSKCTRGKHGFYSVVTYIRWLQRKCKCVKSTRRITVICRCNKGNTQRLCNKRSGIVTISKISFRKSVNKRQCRRIVNKRIVRISCRRRWQLIRKVKRGRYLLKTYRRSVRVGCKCIWRRRVTRCLIRCSKCKTVTRCSRHKTKVIVRFCWRAISCRCVRRKHVSYRKITCSRMRIIRKCNKSNCIRTEKQIRFVSVNCKCKRQVKIVRNRCCCPKPKSSRRCIRGSIRIRKLNWRLISGRCRVKSRDIFVRIRCSSRRRFAISGKCVRGRRKYRMYFYKKVGCKCLRRVKTVMRPCFCARKAVELYFAVDLHDKNLKGYRPAARKFISKTCSTFHKQKVLARTTFLTYGTRVGVKGEINKAADIRIKQITNNLFVKRRTVLSSAINKIYRLVRYRRKRHVHPIVVIISCGKHPNSHRIVSEAKKLKRVASVLVVHVGKLSSRNRYLKLVASAPASHNFVSLSIKDLLQVNNHKFPVTQLFERVCKRSCKRPVLRRSRCNRRSCKRIYTKISFTRNLHGCKRRARSWRRDCCCNKKGRRFTVCRKNRKYTVTVSYRFNALREICIKKVRKNDVTEKLLRSCRPRIQIFKGKCRKMWRRDLVLRRSVSACKCIVSRSHRKVRCGCPSSFSRRRCLGRSKWQRCVTSYSLISGKCKRITKCSSSSVNCKRPWRKVSTCKNCRQKFSKVWYQIHRCKCIRRYSVITKRCCCSKRVNVKKFCDRRRHRYVTVKQWLKLVNGKCVKMSRNIYRKVKCSGSKRIFGKCRAARGHFYRRVTLLQKLRRGCSCITKRRITHQLCRCRNGRRIRNCRSGIIILRKIYWKKVAGRCRQRKSIIYRRTVTCRTKRVRFTGKCNISKKGLRYRRVTLTYQKRLGCKCKNMRKVILQLCGCQKSHSVIRCRNNRVRVRTVYSYRLYRGKCIRSSRNHTQRISCKLAKSKLYKCNNGYRIAKVTVYRSVNCHCKPKIYSRKVKCQSCSDLLPHRICRKWAADKLIKLCDNHPHYAAKLCPATCGICLRCRKSSVIYAGRIYMRNQIGFRSSYIIGNSKNLQKCIKSCNRNKKCRSVNFSLKSKKCFMMKVTRRDILVRSGRSKLKLGGTWLLFEKVCRKNCRYRKFVKKYKCRCRFIGKKVCYRMMKVATFGRNSSGICTRRIRLIRVPCRQCEDLTYRKWCLSHRNQCRNGKVRKKCPLTCGVCKRKPLVLTQKGKCINGKLTVKKFSKFYDKISEIWRVKIWRSSKPCVRCQTGSYSIIGECIGGNRKVSRVIAKIVANKCRIQSKTKIISCRGCPFSLRRVIGRCVKKGKYFTRNVVTFFTVRKNNKCIVWRNRRVFHCSRRCRPDRVSRSRCICGKRIRCVTYFVTFPGSRVCVPKTHSSTEICQSAGCKDKLRLIDCLTVKRNGMCKSKGMQNLCARSCGFCK